MSDKEKDGSVYGYDDTPLIPGTEWRVHDSRRPQPRIVRPGSVSTENTPGGPPADGVVLFDGKDISQWRDKDGDEAKWKVQNGILEVTAGTGNIMTKEAFGDCQLHVEWATPEKVDGDGQRRGNSGVFLMGLYEMQVLDSFDNRTYADGHAGSLYGQHPPLVNASRGPNQWQVYDIVFTAPRFDGGTLVSPAYITLLHNGVLVQNHQPALGPTGHRELASYNEPHDAAGPLMLQDHKNPVQYRNIWIRRL